MGKLFGKGEDIEEKEETETEESKSIEERIEHLMEQKKETIRKTILDDINNQLEGRFKEEIDELKTFVTWTEPITGEDLLRIVEKGGAIFRNEITQEETRYSNPRVDAIIETFCGKNMDFRRHNSLTTANKYRVTIIVEPL